METIANRLLDLDNIIEKRKTKTELLLRNRADEGPMDFYALPQKKWGGGGGGIMFA